MNKMNKKGFTLIEMLVVIAIIAVLVSIVIPTVSSATGKAAAATDAANLRSMVAEATTDYLNGQTETAGYVSYTKAAASATDAAKYGTFSVNDTAPKCKTNKEYTASITFDKNGNITAKFGTYELKHYAYVAENGGTLDEAVSALGSTPSGDNQTPDNGDNQTPEG